MSTTTQGDLSVTRVNRETWYHGFTEAASTKYWAAAARISIGFVFLWAFLDKNFGWQYTTPGRSGLDVRHRRRQPHVRVPDVRYQPRRPLAGFFNSLGESAGVASAEGAPVLYPGSWVNWAFMLALLGIGISLMIGFMVRIGSIGGVALLLAMWLAEAPWANTIDPETGQGSFNNPFMDDHIIYAIVLVMLMLFTAERTFGVGKWWQSTSLVQRHPWLA